MRPIFEILRSLVQRTQLSLNHVCIGTSFAPVSLLRELAVSAGCLDTGKWAAPLVTRTLEARIAILTAVRKFLIHDRVAGQRRVTEADARAIHEKTPTVVESER